MRILVVEDEKSILNVLAKRLSQEGYSVDMASDGQEALGYIEMGVYDCIVMDIMLPIQDGLTVLRQMRKKHNKTPVLLLTAKDGIGDKVLGLDAGADDYLVKPFIYDELSARIRALVRRNSEQTSTILQYADLTLDLTTRAVTRGNQHIELSAKGFTILSYFLHNPNRVLTRDQIIDHAWNFDYDNDSNVIDVYVGYLRRKIDNGFDNKLLHTVRGVGYVLRDYNEKSEY
ncbi:DNA-binding response OmpR family regulator [Orbus hercynius]|uniref:DNA-binding response OmpR family regulator n=1 Tax=Orbus hercynius TaxID=593135 RepID=A0A495RFT4_9GAMM|nr:response regulator transcription factor [Orbus hercynius]RKS85748.1 DNA-binding response OmpR family regulator [Orbus hercynius]